MRIIGGRKKGWDYNGPRYGLSLILYPHKRRKREGQTKIYFPFTPSRLAGIRKTDTVASNFVSSDCVVR
jgi:hypothetical protein